MSEDENKSAVSTNVVVTYGNDEESTPIRALQHLNFQRYKGGGTVNMSRVIFDRVSIEDMFGTPDELEDVNLYIEDKSTGLKYCFKVTHMHSIETFYSKDSFVITEHVVLGTDHPVKRTRL